MRPYFLASKIWIDLDAVQSITPPTKDDVSIHWHCAFRDKPDSVFVEYPNQKLPTAKEVFSSCVPAGKPSVVKWAFGDDHLNYVMENHFKPFFEAWKNSITESKS